MKIKMAAPMEFRWNTFKHEYPSNAVFTVWKQKSKLPNCTSTKTELVKMFNEACMFLEPVFKTYLSAESCTLRRLLYKLKNQQKHWKRFSLLEKIQKCLNRALEINLHQQFKIILSFCEIKKDLGDMEQVPSGTSIKFLLEKVVGLSKLCACIMQLSQQTFILIVGNLQIGEFVVQNLIFTAIISRIWILVRGVLIKLFSWYDLLRKFSMQNQQSKYYTMFKELPECLSKWIDLDIASLKVTIKKITKKSKQDTLGKMFGTLQNSSESSLHSKIEQDLNNKDELYTAMEACSEMDIGEPVIQDDKNVIPKRKKKLSLCEVADDIEKRVGESETEDRVENCDSKTEDIVQKVLKKKKRKKKKSFDDDEYVEVNAKDKECITEHRVEDVVKKVKRNKKKLLPEVNKYVEDITKDEERIAEDRMDNVVKKKKKKKKKVLYDDIDDKYIDDNAKDEESIAEDRMDSVVKRKKKESLYDDDVDDKYIDNAEDEESITEHRMEDIVKKVKRKKKKLLPEVEDITEEEDGVDSVVKKKKKESLYDDIDDKCIDDNTKDEESIAEDRMDSVVKKKKKKVLYDDDGEYVENISKDEDRLENVVKKKKQKLLYDDIDDKYIENNAKGSKIENRVENCDPKDMVDNVVKKRKKKKRCEDLVESSETKDENRTEDTVDDIKMNRIKNSDENEGGRTCKKAKRKKEKLVGKDLVTSEMEVDNIVDPSLQNENSNTDVIGKIKNKKKVEEQETLSMIEKKHKKRRHKNGNETAMEICDAPEITKRRKLLNSGANLQYDDKELDDIFSCLE